VDFEAILVGMTFISRETAISDSSTKEGSGGDGGKFYRLKSWGSSTSKFYKDDEDYSEEGHCKKHRAVFVAFEIVLLIFLRVLYN